MSHQRRLLSYEQLWTITGLHRRGDDDTQALTPWAGRPWRDASVTDATKAASPLDKASLISSLIIPAPLVLKSLVLILVFLTVTT